MSKMFFKGRIETRQNHVLSGYNVNRKVKAGTQSAPIAVTVNSAQRQEEIERLAEENQLTVTVTIDADSAENIVEFETVLNKPQTTTFEKTPNRNDPCSCGSGKKFKKCCA